MSCAHDEFPLHASLRACDNDVEAAVANGATRPTFSSRASAWWISPSPHSACTADELRPHQASDAFLRSILAQGPYG